MRVSTKKRLRKLTVLHSNVEAIQIQRSYLEDAQNGIGTVHPVAVRKKIPFKKKVRERRSKHNRSKKEHHASSKTELQKMKASISKKVKQDQGKVEVSPSSQPTVENLPGPSGTSSSLTNHNHEVKRAIVPHAKRFQ